ncbi:hypothetical protein GQ600_16398 [Phytophthora cactorum]|nr:hypothetical protein GQ600_16398 [Phytophthora cactorum]
MFFYHGSIGFYSFYEEVAGTYCTIDHTLYGLIDGLGTFDINGWLLAQDTGSYNYRASYWYGTVGMVWIIYRGLVIRRSYIACRRYGRRCDQMQESIRRRTAMVFVHENMRLSAHGATNYHRLVLLYLLIEGIMSDLFLLVATDGIFAWFQYISFGYNLSGMLLILFELIENMQWLHETSRLFIKRLLFSYESSLLGELLSAIGQARFLTSLSHSDLKQSGPTARAVSYYVTHCACDHLCVVETWPNLGRSNYSVQCRYHPGNTNKMTTLTGYCWVDGNLCYKPEALKAFGMLKVEEEDGAEFMALRKLHWFKHVDRTVKRYQLSGHYATAAGPFLLESEVVYQARDTARPATAVHEVEKL